LCAVIVVAEKQLNGYHRVQFRIRCVPLHGAVLQGVFVSSKLRSSLPTILINKYYTVWSVIKKCNR